ESLEEGGPNAALSAHFPLNEGQGGELAARLPADRRVKAAETLEWAKGGRFGAAPVLRKDTAPDLGDLGGFAANEPFTVALWVRSPKDGFSGAIVARMDDVAKHRGWDLLQENRSLAFHLIDT